MKKAFNCLINGNTEKEYFFLNILTVYLLFIVLSLTTLQANATFVTVAKYVRYLCYAAVILILLVDAYNGKSIWMICLVGALTVLMALQSDARDYLFYIFMIIAAKDVDFRKIIERACIVQGIVLAVFVIGSQIGLVENYTFTPTTRIRYGLGFTWTTAAPILFFFFMMCWVYLRRERMRIYEFAVLEAINAWLFYETDTRFSFYLSTILLVYVFFMRYFWQNREERIHKNRWLIITPAACCVGAVLLHVCYNPDNERWTAFNELLSGRLSLGKAALEEYGITLFGQPITWVGNDRLMTGTYNYVDSSYMQILLQCGVIFLILVIAMYTFMMFMAVKTKDFYLQTILLFIVVFSITEPRLMNLKFNPFPFFAAAIWSVRAMEDLCEKKPSFTRQVRIRTAQIRLKNRS